MLIHVNGVLASKITQLSRVAYSQPEQNGLQNFPALIIDRYTGIVELTIWGRVGEALGLPEQCYSVYIGAFCPLSQKLMFLVDVNHDYSSVSMSGEVPDLIPHTHHRKRKGSLIIQNDVWIGYGVTILSGVTIHNGAVVAANSTVTRDVPPYAIVAGNPAKVIKYRFDPETIERLQKIQWWYWDEATIRKRKSWFQRPPEEFAAHFAPSTEGGRLSSVQGLQDEQLEGIAREHLYVTFSDLDEPHSILFKIIQSFALSHTAEDWLIVAIPKDQQQEETTRRIYTFAEGIQADCGLYVRCTSDKETPDLISACGTLVTSRVLQLVRYTCLADLAGTKVVSGVDVPIF